jgi:hypothetical protein
VVVEGEYPATAALTFAIIMESWEKDLISTAADTLSRLPVYYPDNYEQPPANWPKKIGTIQVEHPRATKRL